MVSGSRPRKGNRVKIVFLLFFVFRHVGGSGRFIDDPDDFLLSLVNKIHVKPIKLTHLPSKPYGIYTANSYGPTFGGGHDLHISNNANSNSNSYTNLGHTYKAPPGQQANSFLAGAYNFIPNEVETFYLVTQNQSYLLESSVRWIFAGFR